LIRREAVLLDDGGHQRRQHVLARHEVADQVGAAEDLAPAVVVDDLAWLDRDEVGDRLHGEGGPALGQRLLTRASRVAVRRGECGFEEAGELHVVGDLLAGQRLEAHAALGRDRGQVPAAEAPHLVVERGLLAVDEVELGRERDLLLAVEALHAHLNGLAVDRDRPTELT
jgi:hypothetical protein